MNLDDREHKLYDTDHKTYGPDNNRNHCQSVQAFTSSYIKIWQKAKPTAPFWVAMFVSKLLSLTYKHQNCIKHLKSRELFQTFFCGFSSTMLPNSHISRCIIKSGKGRRGTRNEKQNFHRNYRCLSDNQGAVLPLLRNLRETKGGTHGLHNKNRLMG